LSTYLMETFTVTLKGICQGLHYIHQERINHLDLKPANVLLGANMEPKITDFGVSRCISEEQCTMITKNFFGTLGYVAPEFIDKQQISFKSDIYSLGVIMTNLLSGHNVCIPEKVRIIYQSLFVILFLQQILLVQTKLCRKYHVC